MNKKPTVLGVFLILLMTIISPTTSISKQSSNTISLNDNGWEEEDNTPPNLTIIFPELGLYLFNQKIMNLSKSIIAVGPVDIIAEASDDESGIDYVEYELVRFPTFIMGVFQGESYI